MIKLSKFRVIEISAAVVLTLAALLILGWQAWAGGEKRSPRIAEPQGTDKVIQVKRLAH